MSLSGLGGSSDEEAESAIMAEINITPLTDIFLVLLIIFMVTSSVMSQTGVGVQLPTASKESVSSQPGGVVLSLLPGGVMRLNDKTISAQDWKSLRKELQVAFQQTSSRVVILEGDKRAFLGSAIEVMDQARAAGAQGFSIAATAK